MKKEKADAWIAALESGEYKKGKGMLTKNVNGEIEYCCLGVLCEISGVDKELKGNQYIFGQNSYGGIMKDIQEACGIISCNGKISSMIDLASVNDTMDTFKEVIELIKENWKIL